MGQLKFACGASYDGLGPAFRGPIHGRNGTFQRMIVMSLDGQVKSPMKDGKEIQCLLCPATVKASGRINQRAWVGENAMEPKGEPTRIVRCRPVSWQEDEV